LITSSTLSFSSGPTTMVAPSCCTWASSWLIGCGGVVNFQFAAGLAGGGDRLGCGR
jgi:hypothetical protein